MTLREILDILIDRITFMRNQQPSFEFVQSASKDGGNFMAGVRMKFMKREFQLLFEFVSDVILPRSEKRIVASIIDLFLMEFLISLSLLVSLLL